MKLLFSSLIFYVENSTFILIEVRGHCREFGKYIEVQIK